MNKQFEISKQLFLVALRKTKQHKAESENSLITLASLKEMVLHAKARIGKERLSTAHKIGY